MRVLRFRVGGQLLGLPAEQVEQVLAGTAATPSLPRLRIPGTGAPVGTAVLQVRRRGSGPAVLPVEAVEDFIEVNEAWLAPLPALLFAGGRSPYRGLFTSPAGPVALLEVEALEPVAGRTEPGGPGRKDES